MSVYEIGWLLALLVTVIVAAVGIRIDRGRK